jgi:hypothetical protein
MDKPIFLPGRLEKAPSTNPTKVAARIELVAADGKTVLGYLHIDDMMCAAEWFARFEIQNTEGLSTKQRVASISRIRKGMGYSYP